jgi:hypothetical protein
MPPLLDIVIVNWNTGKQLAECIASIKESRVNCFNLNNCIVVDNCSSDDSTLGIENIGIPLDLIKNTLNEGFAKACNRGANGSSADYLLFLNPDTRLFDRSLEKSIAFMERPDNSKISVCGIQLVDELGEVSRSCSRLLTLPILISEATGLSKVFPQLFPSQFMHEWDHSTNRDVEEVIGAFFLVRKEVFDLLGGFDERFFVYYEEVDFCCRVIEHGYRVFYLAEAQAFHKGGGSSEKVKAHRLFYSLRSRILYVEKHFSPVSKFVGIATTLLLEPFTRIGFALLKGSLSSVSETIHGYGMLYQWLFEQGLKGGKPS